MFLQSNHRYIVQLFQLFTLVSIEKITNFFFFKGPSPRPASPHSSVEVRMTFDKGTRVLKGRKFDYVEDPKIDYANSGSNGGRKVPKGIPSGGINITVVGANFKYIQDPEIYIIFPNNNGKEQRYTGRCTVENDTQMHCLSPKIDVPVPFKNLDNPEPIKVI